MILNMVPYPRPQMVIQIKWEHCSYEKGARSLLGPWPKWPKSTRIAEIRLNSTRCVGKENRDSFLTCSATIWSQAVFFLTGRAKGFRASKGLRSEGKGARKQHRTVENGREVYGAMLSVGREKP